MNSMKQRRWLISLKQPKTTREEETAELVAPLFFFDNTSTYHPFRALFQALWHISCIYFATDEDRISFYHLIFLRAETIH